MYIYWIDLIKIYIICYLVSLMLTYSALLLLSLTIYGAYSRLTVNGII